MNRKYTLSPSMVESNSNYPELIIPDNLLDGGLISELFYLQKKWAEIAKTYRKEIMSKKEMVFKSIFSQLKIEFIPENLKRVTRFLDPKDRNREFFFLDYQTPNEIHLVTIETITKFEYGNPSKYTLYDNYKTSFDISKVVN